MGGKGGSNLAMAVIREHLAAKGLGLHNDLQNEHSIVGNNPFILMFKEFATPEQYERYGAALLEGQIRSGFGLTEPNHGSDATFMETRAVREEKDGVPGWRINGEKMWTTGMHVATHIMVFARTSGEDGDAVGHHRLPGSRRRSGGEDRGVAVDLQHAHRPPARQPHRRLGLRRRHLGRGGPGPGPGPKLRAPEPHPPGRLVAGRGRLLHRGERALRPRPQALRQAALRQPGDPVAAGGTGDAGRDAAAADPQDRLGDGPHAPQGGRAADLRQGLDVQLLGQPAVLRGRRPRHAGARRHGLFAPQAVRTHLPPPPPLPHHRRQRGNPEAQGGGIPVRLYGAEEGGTGGN